MHTSQQRPYFTPNEIIQFIVNAIDIKHTSNSLRDNARKIDADYRNINLLIEEYFLKQTKKHIGSTSSNILFTLSASFIKNYLKVVSSISLEELSRKEIYPILSENYFSKFASICLINIHKEFGGPSPLELVSTSESAISTMIKWFENNYKHWNEYVKKQPKETKDKIDYLKRGDHIPSFGTILEIGNKFRDSEKIKILMLTARTLDYCKKYDANKSKNNLVNIIHNTLEFSGPKNNLKNSVELYRKNNSKTNINVTSFHKALHILSLNITRKRKDGDKINSKLAIQETREALKSYNENQVPFYLIDWLEARWNIFNGNLEVACSLYEKAFDGCLYRAGDMQELIINESLVVSASQKKPNNTFLKRLKNMSLTFSYDIPSVKNTEGKTSNKTDDFIEDWEIDLWGSQFKNTFPDNMLFSDVTYEKEKPRKGLLEINTDKMEPDLKHPNRKMKIGETWKKKMPQIIYFTLISKSSIVINLLDAGADINVFSDSKDTPILISIQGIKQPDSNRSSNSEKIFDSLILHKHNAETLNTPTQKKRLLPLISAIETGRHDIVKKVLDMGASSNQRGTTDELSPLYFALNLIYQVKKPEVFINNLTDAQTSPEVLDSIRRYTNGSFGHTLKQQEDSINHYLEKPEYKKILEDIAKIQIMNEVKYNIESLRKIVRLLIKYDANPDDIHLKHTVEHTPKTFAFEIGEENLLYI